jgi:UDP-N-acetylglucosamine 1-carboxyvinyltransferase
MKNDSILKVSKSKLEGIVEISGAKNSVLKLLTASLLTSENISISNYPAGLLDAQIHVGMLEVLGKKCVVGLDKISIIESKNIQTTLKWDERSIRNTLLILGCLLTRKGTGKVPLPGGCKLGDRKYDLHIDIFEKMGAKVWEEDNYLCAEAKGRLKGADIFLPIRSTGATENAILCATLAEGTTRIWGPHIRPEIIDLIHFLNKMGAKIKVFGQEHIEVIGVEELYGTTHEVIPDNMEALTWLIAGTVTKGDLEIKNFPFEHLEVPLIHLRESGSIFYRNNSDLIVRSGTPYPIEISTGPYPGINSDMQPLFAVYAAFAKGQSKIIDLRFANRFSYADEMAKMGLHSRVEDNMLIIKGVSSLKGSKVTAIDLRAGAALLIAGLASEGETIIHQPWMIMRGYNNILKKLEKLGANIITQA